MSTVSLSTTELDAITAAVTALETATANRPKRKTIPDSVSYELCTKYFSHGVANCFCCGYAITPKCGWHRSHVLAISRGGDNSVDNLRICCVGCNGNMGTMHMFEYIMNCHLDYDPDDTQYGQMKLTQQQKDACTSLKKCQRQWIQANVWHPLYLRIRELLDARKTSPSERIQLLGHIWPQFTVEGTSGNWLDNVYTVGSAGASAISHTISHTTSPQATPLTHDDMVKEFIRLWSDNTNVYCCLDCQVVAATKCTCTRSGHVFELKKTATAKSCKSIHSVDASAIAHMVRSIHAKMVYLNKPMHIYCMSSPGRLLPPTSVWPLEDIKRALDRDMPVHVCLLLGVVYEVSSVTCPCGDSGSDLDFSTVHKDIHKRFHGARPFVDTLVALKDVLADTPISWPAGGGTYTAADVYARYERTRPVVRSADIQGLLANGGGYHLDTAAIINTMDTPTRTVQCSYWFQQMGFKCLIIPTFTNKSLYMYYNNPTWTKQTILESFAAFIDLSYIVSSSAWVDAEVRTIIGQLYTSARPATSSPCCVTTGASLVTPIGPSTHVSTVDTAASGGNVKAMCSHTTAIASPSTFSSSTITDTPTTSTAPTVSTTATTPTVTTTATVTTTPTIITTATTPTVTTTATTTPTIITNSITNTPSTALTDMMSTLGQKIQHRQNIHPPYILQAHTDVVEKVWAHTFANQLAGPCLGCNTRLSAFVPTQWSCVYIQPWLDSNVDDWTNLIIMCTACAHKKGRACVHTFVVTHNITWSGVSDDRRKFIQVLARLTRTVVAAQPAYGQYLDAQWTSIQERDHFLAACC